MRSSRPRQMKPCCYTNRWAADKLEICLSGTWEISQGVVRMEQLVSIKKNLFKAKTAQLLKLTILFIIKSFPHRSPLPCSVSNLHLRSFYSPDGLTLPDGFSGPPPVLVFLSTWNMAAGGVSLSPDITSVTVTTLMKHAVTWNVAFKNT